MKQDPTNQPGHVINYSRKKHAVGITLALLSLVCILSVINTTCQTRPTALQTSSFCDMDKEPPKHVLEKTHRPRCPTTFVTEYFKIPSKHSNEQYIQWIKNLKNLCLIIFTDSPALWNITDQVLIKTTICAEGRALNRSQSFWRQQWYQDPEASIHKSYQLYLTWNLKPYFMSQAVNMNPFASDYFFWIDAGYMRTPKLGDARSLIPPVDNSAVHFLLGGQFTPPELSGHLHYTVSQDRIGGGMFGGHASTIAPWSRLYYRMLQEYVDRGWFVGKDQNIMATLCAEQPAACVLLDPRVWFWQSPWFAMWDCLLRQRDCTVRPIR